MGDKHSPATETVEKGLSREVAFEDVPPEGLCIRLHADVDDRNGLAERLAVSDIENVEAEFEISRFDGDDHLFDVSVRVRAELTQKCVVTLEPLTARIESVAALRFTDLEEMIEEDWDHTADDEDPPELAEGGVIDLGDLVAQQLALEIDPFPRAEGVPFIEVSSGEMAESTENQPFAALAALRDKLKE
jgi:uncharacterized metal-binding protein YceD (DUF177 family)